MKKNIETLEFGYSHEEDASTEFGYRPIVSFSGRTWFDTLEEAERQRKNDLRWRPETFIISRPKPERAERFVPDATEE